MSARTLDRLAGGASRPPATAELAKTAQGIRGLAVEPHPVLDLAERWLAARVPDPPRVTRCTATIASAM